MAASNHFVKIPVSQEEVWTFIQDINNWAPLIPGYISHEWDEDQTVIWKFNGDFGFAHKHVKMKIILDELQQPDLVRFHLKGISDSFNGSGYFKATSINSDNTTLEGSLDISSGGVLATMLNSILKVYVPKTVLQFTEQISEQIAN